MKLLEKLISASGVSGHEEEVREIIKNEIKGFVDEISVDNFGNLVAYKKGIKPRVMLAAHMDEIGLIVKSIDDNGRIHFSKIGEIEVATLLGQKVVVKGKKDILSLITTKEMSVNEKIDKLPKIDELLIDTGLTKEELIDEGVETGTCITFFQPCSYLTKDLICGKALDNRIGCYILVELAKRLRENKNEIFYVFTVQEEIGLYGAKTSVYEIQPAYAIAVDTTAADDFSSSPIKKLGDGPCITIKSGEMLGNRCLNDWLKKTANEENIPIQFNVSEGEVTDALAISLSRGGIPTTTVSVPVRNIHTVMGIADKKDIDNAIKLLEGLLRNPPLVCVV